MNLQKEIDQLAIEHKQKKREVERGLAEMRTIRKRIDVLEDMMIIEAMKMRETPKKEVL